MPDINCTIDKDAIQYAIAKQVPRMEYIHTAYGDIELDVEMAAAVQEALERVLYKRIDERPPVDTLVVEMADVQREAIDQMVGLTGKSDDSLAQAMFDYGFEAMDGLARMIKKL